MISRTGGPGLTVDDLLEDFKSPLLLLWGELDPWIRPAAADKIQVRPRRVEDVLEVLLLRGRWHTAYG